MILQKSAATSPEADDPRLRSRRFHHPFRSVWRAALGVVSARARWMVEEQDPRLGTIRVRIQPRFGSAPDELLIELSLDELGRTRVDVASRTTGSALTLGRHPRRIGGVLRSLEQRLRNDG